MSDNLVPQAATDAALRDAALLLEGPLGRHFARSADPMVLLTGPTGPTGLVCRLNAAAEALLGDPAAWVGAPLPDALAASLAEALGGESGHAEATISLADGRVVAVEAVATALDDEPAGPRLLTLRERPGFDALALLRHLPNSVTFTDLSGVIRYTNPTGAAILGVSPSRMIGRRTTELFPEAAEAIQAMRERVLATGEPVTLRAQAIRKPDEPRRPETYWDITSAPVHDAAGRCLGLIAIGQEVTERLRLEGALEERHAALEEANARLAAQGERERQQARFIESLINHLPAAIAFREPDSRLKWVNPAHCRLVGLEAERMLGKTFQEVFPEATDDFVPLLEAVAAAGEPLYIANKPFRHHAGGVEHLSHWDVVYVPVFDDNRRLEGILSLGLEMSERVERERLQAAQLEQLQAADRYKDEFISVISHELRTPLNFITAFASMLGDGVAGELNAEQGSFVARILTGADRMLYLVNDLLDVARMQAGSFQLVTRCAPLAPLVAEVVDTLGPLAANKGLSLDATVEVAQDVRLDPDRIQQVITNLVGNAIKFTASGGVTVSARVEGGSVVVRVADTGQGIHEGDLPRLFSRFQQLDMSATRAQGGTGLGLAIAKAIVEAHHGAIGAESMPGRGSTFWFSLPLGEGEGAAGR